MAEKNTKIVSGAESLYRVAIDQYNDPLDFIAILQTNDLESPFITQPQSVILPPNPTNKGGVPLQPTGKGTGIQPMITTFPYTMGTFEGVTISNFAGGEIYSLTTNRGKIVTSVDGSTVLIGSVDQLTDKQNNKWTISDFRTISVPATVNTAATTVEVGLVTVNGIVDRTSKDVVQIAYVNGLTYYQDNLGLWYSKALPTDAWSKGLFDSPLLTAFLPVVTVAQSVLPGPVQPFVGNTTPTTATIFWTAPVGTQPIYYQVQYRLSGSSLWLNIGSQSTATNLDITGLTPNSLYDVQVLDLNGQGIGPSTPITLSFQTAFGANLPGPVTPMIANIGPTSIVLSWITPTGTAPFSYEILYRVSGTQVWITTANVTALAEGIANLLPNTSYDFEIIATNSVGSSTSTPISSATTLSLPVSSVGIPLITNIAQTTLTIGWSIPSGTPPFTYQIQNRVTGTIPWSLVAGTSATTFNVSNLLSNTNYDFRVIPSDATTASSVVPDIVSITTVTTIAPPPPIGAVLAASAISRATATPVLTTVLQTSVESLQGTTVTTIGPQLVDAFLETFSISSTGFIVQNGVPDTTSSANVVLLLYWNHLVYQENSSGNWYFKSRISDTYVGPVTDPRPPAIVESAQNTLVTTVGPALFDSVLEAFTITSGGQIAVNGITDATTSRVVLLLYWNHLVYQENLSNDWYFKSVASDTWSAPTTDPRNIGRNYLLGLRDGNPTDTTTATLMGQAWDYTINFSYEDPWAGASISGLAVSDRPGTPVIAAVYHLDNGSPPYMDATVAANGGYNAFYTQTAQSLIPYANIIYGIRIDHEFNGTWEPFGPFGGAGQLIDAATWIAGWRHMAQAIRTALPNVKIIWNPNIGQNNPYPYYPGDDLVDVVGFDAYTQPAFSGGLTSMQMWQEYLNGQGGNNFTTLAAFGVAHNKPLCFPEWGDGFGDGVFITQFGAWMDQHNVVAHSYWDSADGLTNTTALTQLPANQTAFVNAFGHRPYTGTFWPERNPSIQAPAQAVSAGFTVLTGGAEFNNSSDVTNDISGGNTTAALYNWDGGSQAMSTSGWSIANSILTITAATNHGQGLETLCNSNAPISIGPVSTHGRQTNVGTGMLYRYFYAEASMRFNWQAGPGPTFWTWAYNNGGAPNTLELDVVEIGTDSNIYSFWHGHGASGDDGPNTGGNASLNGNLTGWSVPNQQLNKTSPAQFNKYGLLWTPTKVEWYYNDVLIQNFATNTPIPWSDGSNETANTIDNMGSMALAFIFGTWSDQMDIDYLRVWQ
jgi:hypothetical protein